jgi:nucleotide-binding universal stress UspA family protein
MSADRHPGDIVVGVDDSTHAQLAARWAAEEAERRGCALTLVHAVDTTAATPVRHIPSDVTARILCAAGTLLDEVAAQVRADHPGLRVNAALERGTPAETILEEAEDTALVVVGTRGRGGFASLLLGSVSLKVAARAACPVVVVRGEAERDPARDVVVGVRDERDRPAVRFALASAQRRRRATVRVVHAWSLLADSGLMVPQAAHVDEAGREQARLVSGALGPVGEYPSVRLETDLVTGSAAAALVDASADASLLVITRHPSGNRFGPHLGSVAHAVLHHARCPVAVVPAEQGASPPTHDP